MKNLKNKKDNAEILSNFGPILITALVVLILIVLFGSWMANFEKKDKVNQITRKYILKMETKGGLDDDDELALRAELAPYCANVELQYDGKRTTKPGEVQYGEDIDLYVKADMYTYSLHLIDDSSRRNGTLFQLVNDDGEVKRTADNNTYASKTAHTTELKIHRSSTSKH